MARQAPARRGLRSRADAAEVSRTSRRASASSCCFASTSRAVRREAGSSSSCSALDDFSYLFCETDLREPGGRLARQEPAGRRERRGAGLGTVVPERRHDWCRRRARCSRALGAVVPAAPGPTWTSSIVEFESLGTNFGLAETVPPSSPPAPAPDVPEPAPACATSTRQHDDGVAHGRDHSALQRETPHCRRARLAAGHLRPCARSRAAAGRRSPSRPSTATR